MPSDIQGSGVGCDISPAIERTKQNRERRSSLTALLVTSMLEGPLSHLNPILYTKLTMSLLEM